MRLGQPMQFFDAATQTHPPHFAAPNRDQRVRQLVAFAQSVLCTEGVQVSKDPLPTPWRLGDHDDKGEDQNTQDEEEHPGIDAAQEQDPHGNRRNDQESAHVGLGQQEHPGQTDGGAHGPDRFEEVLFDIHLAHHVIGGINDGCQFGQLGRLKVHHPKRNPAPRTVDALANERQQHQGQQDQRQNKQGPGHFFPSFHRHLEGQ